METVDGGEVAIVLDISRENLFIRSPRHNRLEERCQSVLLGFSIGQASKG